MKGYYVRLPLTKSN